ncbi:MAG TPA: hypothetical protein VFH31_05500 [Pyrinomonadaceae bacterium]|nr:hypothetical protein [Pyrinomonadaceae bacterium]
MSSQIDIANRALTKLGADRIISLDDDVKAARAILSMWDIVRDAELRAHNWSFSIKRAALAASVTTPAYGYEYQYPVPADFLRLLSVGEYYPPVSLTDYRQSDDSEWRIEGRSILHNDSGPLYIRYVYRVEDTSQWDSAFVESFACRLAAELAEDLTQSNQKRELAWQERKQAISDAIRTNAIELPPEPLADDTWIMTRL